MEDLMYQLRWLSNQDNYFYPWINTEEEQLARLFEIEAYRSCAALESECQQASEEAHAAMDEAEQEINSAVDSVMEEFKRFAEEFEREAMAEYHSLVSSAEAARKAGKRLEKAASAASNKYIEAAFASATNSMRSAWKGLAWSSRKIHPSSLL